MGNKTCGECRHFRDADFKDMCFWKDQHREACPDFAPLTNGDKIRQMSDGVFAFMITRLILDGCPISKSKTLHGCKRHSDCVNCIKQWLNAPAESEEGDEENV